MKSATRASERGCPDPAYPALVLSAEASRSFFSRLSARARSLLCCAVEESLFEHVSLRPASFDVVSARHVLEHSAEPREFLQRGYRLLRPGGLMLLEVPDFGSRVARRQGREWHALCPDTHRFHFSRATLSALLRESGFEVVRCRRYGGLGLPAGPNPGQTAAGSAGGPNFGRRAVQILFRSRSLLWGHPWAGRLARHLGRQVLGMGEYLRLDAVARPPGSGKVSPKVHGH